MSLFPPYRVRLDRAFVPSHKVLAAQFKFSISVWLPGTTDPVEVDAALDTFADYSILPTAAFVAQGGVIPPPLSPKPGQPYVDDELEFGLPSAPPPINQFRFPSKPCRIEPRLRRTERFRLALRDLIDHFTLRFEYDAAGQLFLVLELKPQHRGKPIHPSA